MGFFIRSSCPALARLRRPRLDLESVAHLTQPRLRYGGEAVMGFVIRSSCRALARLRRPRLDLESAARLTQPRLRSTAATGVRL